MVNSKEILRRHGLFPKKSFGQNFLVASPVIEAIAKACIPDDEVGRAHVVELGAGVGALTAALLSRAHHVTAIERDRDLVPTLGTTFAPEVEQGRLRVVEGDAQTEPWSFPLPPSPEHPRVLCGNLPYQITGSLLEKCVHSAEHFDRVVFMIQQEVAERLLAKPGTKTYGALTVFVRAAFDVQRVLTVSPRCFHPPPEVTSAVVRLVPVRPRRAEETAVFRALVRWAFAARRKTLRNAWRALAEAGIPVEDVATQAGISLDARGEVLDVRDFSRMASAVEAMGWSPP